MQLSTFVGTLGRHVVIPSIYDITHRSKVCHSSLSCRPDDRRALVATALPAVAEQACHRDATGDVVLLGGEDGSVTPQPGWKPGDVERIDVTHGAHRVRVRLALQRRRTTYR